MRLTMYAVTKTLLVNFMLVKTFPTMLHGMSFRRLMIMVLENNCNISEFNYCHFLMHMYMEPHYLI